MKKVLKEWYIPAPWGKLALISWGDPQGEPVLLVHGRMDSVATFLPLLQHLPDKYYYVGVDMPGNGKSDPYPIGVQLLRLHFVGALEVALEHLEWDQFLYIGHSMGCEQGLFYNTIYPGRIKAFILLDAQPSLQRLQIHDNEEFFKSFFKEYYDNYASLNNDERIYSERKAVEAVMKARGLTEPQAKLVLSRNLIKVGVDQYRLSWDKRLKIVAPQNYPTDYYYQIFSKNLPPTLFIRASKGDGAYVKGKEAAQKLVTNLKNNLKHFYIVDVEGTHDVHLTNPERFVKDILKFLNTDFEMKSKL